MKVTKKNRAKNMDLIFAFVKMVHSNPKIVVNDKLYNSIRKKLQILIDEMEGDKC
jgi:hypothetical protein